MDTKNNKSFIFISDFDGTLTNKDFYQIIIDDYLGEEGVELYKAWKRNEHKDIDFLSMIYKSINRNEKEILDDILRIPFDEYAIDFIKKLKASGGEFIILSAGTNYYIHRLLNNLGLNDIQVFSNEGYYNESGIHLKIDEKAPFYSERYGIDKAKVVASFKEQYDKVYFAGDSGPDVNPALLSDITFAKNELQTLLSNIQHPFVPINNYKDVEKYLVQEGVL